MTAIWVASLKWVRVSVVSPGILVVLNWRSYCHEQSGTVLLTSSYNITYSNVTQHSLTETMSDTKR